MFYPLLMLKSSKKKKRIKTSQISSDISSFQGLMSFYTTSYYNSVIYFIQLPFILVLSYFNNKEQLEQYKIQSKIDNKTLESLK